MGDRKGTRRVLVGAPAGMRSLRRHRFRRYNTIKRGLQDVGWSTEWTDLTQNRDRLQAVMDAVMTSGFHKMRRISCLNAGVRAPLEGFCSTDLVS